jgi:hypothetical protein
MADAALAKNPRSASAFLAKGRLHLVQRRAARDEAERALADRRAREALDAAAHENPLLAREGAAASKEGRASDDQPRLWTRYPKQSEVQ